MSEKKPVVIKAEPAGVGVNTYHSGGLLPSGIKHEVPVLLRAGHQVILLRRSQKRGDK